MSLESTGSTAPPSSAALTKRRLECAILALDAATSHRPRPTLSTAPTKRRRVTQTSLPSLLPFLPPSALPSAPPAPPPQSYTPLSLAHLIKRLATFKLHSFSSLKPESLAALPCALNGWECAPTSTAPKERIACVTCGQGLVLSPPDKGGWKSPLGERLRAEYEKLLATGHGATCPWRTRPCARGLYALPAGNGRKALVEELRGEVDGLEKAGVRGMTLKLPLGLKDERGAIAAALGEGEEVANSTEGDETNAPLLALFGWQPSTDQMVACKFCTRQILLSSFLPSLSNSTPQPFNVVLQHQSFCPYVASPFASTSTTRRSSPLAPANPRVGWQVRLDSLLRKERRRTEGGESRLQEILSRPGMGTPSGKTGARELVRHVREMLGPRGGQKRSLSLGGVQ